MGLLDMLPIMRVALYTRVSTEDQAKEGFSLDAQLERLNFYAKAQGWEIGGVYVDEGHSGRTTKRPKYQKMMEERANWDTILVMKMDRIHRNSRNFMAMMDQLRKEGKEFASVTESLDTSTAMGRFVMDIIQRIAQLESEQIGERVYVGMQQKAKVSGGSMGKPAPFGYTYGPESVLQVVAEERTWVQGVFTRFIAGESMESIASWLADGPKRRRGGQWTRQRVREMLLNPTYAGALPWDGQVQASQHEAIVPPRVFDEAQLRLAKRGETPYLLTRLPGPISG